MGAPENTSLEEVSKNGNELLERICKDSGIDCYQFHNALDKSVDAATYAFQLVAEAFAALMNSLIESFTPVMQTFNQYMENWDEELFWMVPSHIKHLAYHNPKARVRNKNWNRMWKIRERYMKCHKQ